MAFPNSALDVYVAMQLNTMEWVDVTSYVYGNPDSEHIEIQRGRTAEAFGVEPSVATFKLQNDDGRFTPRNPRSPYYGLIGRNIPMRVGVRPRLTTTATNMADLSDTFGRTVALGDSWGTSDTGQTWSKSSVTANNKLSVSSGTGRMLLSTANTTVRVVVDNASYLDVDMYGSFTTPVATGADLVPYILTFRRDSLGNNGGVLQVVTRTTGAVQLQAFGNSAGLSPQLGSTVTVAGLTHTGQKLRVRAMFLGNTIMARVWDPGATSEPTTWHITEQDSAANGGSGVISNHNTVAIGCNAPTGNTNVPFTAQYDDVSITAIEPRFCGEAHVSPRWTKGAPSAGTAWVPVQANGVLSRLQNTQEMGKSALWRFIEADSSGLLGYWSLAAGEPAGIANAEIQRPMLGTLTTRPIASGGAAVPLGVFSHAPLAGWLEDGVLFANTGGFISLDRVNGPSNAGAGWAIDWVRAGGQCSTPLGEALFVTTSINGATGTSWTLDFQDSTTSTNIVITDPNGATHSASLSASGFYDGAAHYMRFTTSKAGSTINYNFSVDGATVLSGSVLAPDSSGAGMLLSPDFQVSDTQAVTYGHISVWDDTAPAVATIADAALGHPDELAGDRIRRVAGDLGIAYYVLDDTNAEALGPQPIGTPYEVMLAAASADRGVLTDLKDAVGVLYYARNTLYSQSDVALTYGTDGHLQDVPEPTEDLANVVNISTVTRTFASSKTYELTTGTLSTAEPPFGVGRKAGDATLNLDDDSRALHLAEWIVALGTVEDSRWPVINLSLAHMALHGLYTLLAQAMRLDSGFRVTVAGPPSFLPPGDIDQLVLGYTETLDQFTWRVDLNGAPFAGYAIGIWDGSPSEFAGRWDTDQSTLASSATSSATSLSVATASGALWTTSAGDFPFDVNISGVRITVTNITGASSPQTFTVTRSVDGFDLALVAGASVRLWSPSRWGL